ncbi:MAG: hypothetical protein WDZ49_01870 [Litorilinea sp.]
MGQLLVQGDVETVKNDPRVIEVYLGRQHADAPVRTATPRPSPDASPSAQPRRGPLTEAGTARI